MQEMWLEHSTQGEQHVPKAPDGLQAKQRATPTRSTQRPGFGKSVWSFSQRLDVCCHARQSNVKLVTHLEHLLKVVANRHGLHPQSGIAANSDRPNSQAKPATHQLWSPYQREDKRNTMFLLCRSLPTTKQLPVWRCNGWTSAGPPTARYKLHIGLSNSRCNANTVLANHGETRSSVVLRW